MSEYKSKEFTELKSIEGIKPINNNVFIHVVPEVYDRLGDTSILLGDNESILDEARRYEPAEHAIRHGTVIAKPEHFQFTTTPNVGADWKTDIEIEVGDEVWFSHLDGYQALVFRCNGEWYYMMDYTRLVLAKRGEQIIMLNGFMLADPCYVKIENKLESALKEEELDYGNAIVTHAGSPVQYKSAYYSSNPDINVGDKVLMANAKAYIWLESDLHLHLDGKKHRVIQRRYVTCKHKKE